MIEGIVFTKLRESTNFLTEGNEQGVLFLVYSEMPHELGAVEEWTPLIRQGGRRAFQAAGMIVQDMDRDGALRKL